MIYGRATTKISTHATGYQISIIISVLYFGTCTNGVLLFMCVLFMYTLLMCVVYVCLCVCVFMCLCVYVFMCLCGYSQNYGYIFSNDRNESNLNLYQTKFIYEYDTSQYVLSS